jgi:dienelactone hydrolase
VEGYLLKPATVQGKVPGVVVLHSTVDHTIRQPAGVEGDSRQFFALRLARRGLVAFCPRCYLWQGPGTLPEHVAALFKRHPGTTGMAKMLWDAERGLDILAAVPEVDANRLGAVGHSLGAKETLYLSAFDERVKAAAFSEGGIGLGFSNWEAPWYLGAQIKTPMFAREHHELLALCAPRPFLLVGGGSADGDASWPYVEAPKGVYELFGKPAPIGFYNHRQGHAVPEAAQDRIETWLEHYLRK